MNALSKNLSLKKDFPVVMVKSRTAFPFITNTSLLVPFLFLGRIIILRSEPLSGLQNSAWLFIGQKSSLLLELDFIHLQMLMVGIS